MVAIRSRITDSQDATIGTRTAIDLVSEPEISRCAQSSVKAR